MSYKPRTEKRGVNKAVAVSATVLTGAAVAFSVYRHALCALIANGVDSPFAGCYQCDFSAALPDRQVR